MGARFESWDDQVKAALEEKARAEADAQATAETAPPAYQEPSSIAPTNGKRKAPRAALAICVAAVVALATSLGAFTFFRMWPPASARSEKRAIPEYAASVLEAKYRAEGFVAEDGATEKELALITEYRDHLDRIAGSMPPDSDQAGRDFLERALDYFDKQDIIEVWMTCMDGAQPFLGEGTTPRDILVGAVTTMHALDIRPDGKQSLRHFVALYTSFRRDEHLNHLRTLAKIVDLRKFGN